MNTSELWRQAAPKRGLWVRPAAVGLAGFLLAAAATGWFFLTRPTGQIVDQMALLGGQSYAEAGSGGLSGAVYDGVVAATDLVVGVVSPIFVIAVVLALLALLIWRREWWLGLGAGVLFAGANLTTQAIKAWWERPDLGLYQVYGNSWPSGHTTVIAAAGFALLLLTPGRWRWVVSVLGAVATTLMAWGVVVNGWHRPSDAIGAICVAAIWYVLVETIRRCVVHVPLRDVVDNRVVARIHDVIAGICAALGVGILAAVAITIPEAPVGQIDQAEQRLAFVGALFGIAAVAFGSNRILLHIGPREDVPHS